MEKQVNLFISDIESLFTLSLLFSAPLRLLQPFVKFVLLHPSSSPELMAASSLLHRQLLSTAKELSMATKRGEGGESQSPLAAIAQLLVKLLPLQPTWTDVQLSSVAGMARELVAMIVELNDTQRMQTTGVRLYSLIPSLCPRVYLHSDQSVQSEYEHKPRKYM